MIGGGITFALVAVLIVVAGWSDPDDGAIEESSPTEGATTTEDTTAVTPADGSSAAPDRTTTTAPRDASTSTTTTTVEPEEEEEAPTATPPPQDEDDPSIVARPIPNDPPPPPPEAPPPPWAASTFTTSAGHVSTDVGCAADLGAVALDAFFAERVGPVIGWDYQHVYPLGGGRHLWIFQDTFIDHSGTASNLGRSGFAHNAALVQDGTCFRLLHGGTANRPAPFETGTGSKTLATWFWPMGGEVHGGRLYVFWAQMVKDPIDPAPPDGLGWHPSETWIATYDPTTFERLDFRRAPNSGAVPIYGYAVVSDASHTYLFGNTFEQNLSREGGYWNGPHSATKVYLARVPRGELFAAPEYRTVDGWSDNPAASVPILDRHWAEFPFQPRLLDGQWVGVAAINGYWGDEYSVDVATAPWGPWTTVEARPLWPRNGDPKMNTYHAHVAPWRDGAGNLVVTLSNNARNMLRDAWPNPWRYRPMVFTSPWVVPPPPAPPTTSTTTTLPPTTSSTSSTSTTSTTTTSTTTTTTTVPPTSTSSSTTTTTSTTSTSTTSTSTTTTTTTTSTPPSSSTSSTSSTSTTEPP